MRPRHLIVSDLMEMMGREKAGRILGVSQSETYKYSQDPLRSGREMPLKKLIDFLTEAALLTGTVPLLRELQLHFTEPAGFVPIHKADLAEIEKMVSGLKNGDSPEKGRGPSGLYGHPLEDLPANCSTCGVPLLFVKKEGRMVPFCLGCQ